jgi:hypothetical protein
MRKRNDPKQITEVPVLFVEDVMRIMGIGQAKAYQLMRQINKELEAEGFLTISGRVSAARFREKVYCGLPGTEKNPVSRFRSRRTVEEVNI